MTMLKGGNMIARLLIGLSIVFGSSAIAAERLPGPKFDELQCPAGYKLAGETGMLIPAEFICVKDFFAPLQRCPDGSPVIDADTLKEICAKSVLPATRK
jgi:hypothetical protein